MSDTAAAALDATTETANASTTAPDASISSAASGPMGLTKKEEIGIAIGVAVLAILLFGFVYWKKKLCFKPKKSVWNNDVEKGRSGTTSNQHKEKDEMDESEEEMDDETEEESEEEKPRKAASKEDKRLSKPAPRRSERAAKTLSTIKEKAEDETRPTRSKRTMDEAGGRKARPKSTVQKARVVNESEEDSELEDEDLEPEPKPKSKSRVKRH